MHKTKDVQNRGFGRLTTKVLMDCSNFIKNPCTTFWEILLWKGCYSSFRIIFKNKFVIQYYAHLPTSVRLSAPVGSVSDKPISRLMSIPLNVHIDQFASQTTGLIMVEIFNLFIYFIVLSSTITQHC